MDAEGSDQGMLQCSDHLLGQVKRPQTVVRDLGGILAVELRVLARECQYSGSLVSSVQREGGAAVSNSMCGLKTMPSFITFATATVGVGIVVTMEFVLEGFPRIAVLRQRNGASPLEICQSVHSIANVLSGNSNSRLRDLILFYTRGVTTASWEAFSTVLRNPNSKLERLNLSCNDSINNHVIDLLADSLTNNDKLKELIVGGVACSGHHVAFSNICATLTHIVYNTSSILSTYNSNHTLGEFRYLSFRDLEQRALPADLISLLRISRENNTSQATRLKIIKLGICHHYVKQKARVKRGKQQVKLRRMMAHCSSSLLFMFVAVGLTKQRLGLLNWSFDAFFDIWQ